MIEKQYPSLNFTIEKNGLGNTTYNFQNFTMTIVDGMTWKDIKRFINKYSENRTDFTCNICQEVNYALVPCNKCSNDICLRCVANIVEVNEGIIKCPYCYLETGWKMPWYNVIQLRNDFLIRNYDMNKAKGLY